MINGELTTKERHNRKYVMHKRNNGLYRIVAKIDIPRYHIKKGDMGGLIENPQNLAYCGECWVSKGAKVTGNARVKGNAYITGNAIVTDNAEVTDNARIFGKAKIGGNALICDSVVVGGNIQVGQGVCLFGEYQIEGNGKIEGDIAITRNLYSMELKQNLLTPKQAATELGISPQMVSNMRVRGTIEAVKVGRKFMITRSEVERMKKELKHD